MPLDHCLHSKAWLDWVYWHCPSVISLAHFNIAWRLSLARQGMATLSMLVLALGHCLPSHFIPMSVKFVFLLKKCPNKVQKEKEEEADMKKLPYFKLFTLVLLVINSFYGYLKCWIPFRIMHKIVLKTTPLKLCGDRSWRPKILFEYFFHLNSLLLAVELQHKPLLFDGIFFCNLGAQIKKHVSLQP